MIWEALECDHAVTQPPAIACFPDRHGHYWLAQAMYFTTETSVNKYLDVDPIDKWWATAVVRTAPSEWWL